MASEQRDLVAIVQNLIGNPTKLLPLLSLIQDAANPNSNSENS
jgi:hypothetical protein